MDSPWPQIVTFFSKKNAKKCDNFGTFTQKILFLDYNKTKKRQKVWQFGVWQFVGHLLSLIV